MSQRTKAIQNKQTGQFMYIVPDGISLESNDHYAIVDVAISKISSPLCTTCSVYDTCKSGIRGNDHDCSDYKN